MPLPAAMVEGQPLCMGLQWGLACGLLSTVGQGCKDAGWWEEGVQPLISCYVLASECLPLGEGTTILQGPC